MKTLKTLSVLACILAFNTAVMAQGLVTLAIKANGTNTITLKEGESAEVKSWYDEYLVQQSQQCSSLAITKNNATFIVGSATIRQAENTTYTPGLIPGLIIAGPATIAFRVGAPANYGAIVTFDVKPSQYPPDKAVTIGPNSGNVKVTMETSKNLVDWTSAENGATYTNSPDARFFRITIDKNAPPGP